MRGFLLALALLWPFAALAAKESAPATFRVSDGKIIGPDGNIFIARGINILDNDTENATAATVTALLPKINFIRLAVGGDTCGYPCAQSNAAIESWVQTMTARNIVVLIESHFTGQPSARSAVNLAGEAAWYAPLAAYFKGNAYVWFGSGNELGNPGLTAEHQNVYNTVRRAGNNNIVVLGVADGNPNGPSDAGSAGAYTDMTNIVWDQHWYNWMSAKGTTDQPTANQAAINVVSRDQTYTTSASGTIPVIFGETGYNDYVCTSNGPKGGICGATQAVNAAMTVGPTHGSGFATWLWKFTPCCGGQTDHVSNKALTGFGRNTAQFIAAGSGPPGSGTGSVGPACADGAGDRRDSGRAGDGRGEPRSRCREQ